MDAFAFSADLVRRQDRERFLADLFAPEDRRRHLFALHAFNIEVARVREVVHEPMPGEIRLQWWRDVIWGEGSGDAAGHPVAAAILETIGLNNLPRQAFDNLIEARIFDLYNDPMPTLADLEGYAGETASALLQCAAIVLAGGRDPGTAEAAGHGGVAQAIAGLLRVLPAHAGRHQVYLPADRMAVHGVSTDDLFAGRSTPGLLALLAELRAAARRHLAAARRNLETVDPALLPAFLPLALVEPALKRMDAAGYDPFRSRIEVPGWRSQWTLWRAARRGRV